MRVASLGYPREKGRKKRGLDYPPCWHKAEFRSNRLTRYLRLNRTNLRLAFSQERADRYWQTLLLKRRHAR